MDDNIIQSTNVEELSDKNVIEDYFSNLSIHDDYFSCVNEDNNINKVEPIEEIIEEDIDSTPYFLCVDEGNEFSEQSVVNDDKKEKGGKALVIPIFLIGSALLNFYTW